jgi:hypothetical protein
MKRLQSVLQRSHFIVAVLIVAVPLVSSCATKRHEVATTRTVTTLHEVQQPAPTTIDVSIVNLHDEAAPDPADEKVVGTIVNAGDKPVSRIAIRVNALDASGQVVRTVTTPPLAQPIGPFGGRATFEAIMPRDRAVAGYHAVAVAQ